MQILRWFVIVLLGLWIFLLFCQVIAEREVKKRIEYKLQCIVNISLLIYIILGLK